MDDNDLLEEPARAKRPAFFRKADWTAFWTATAISFVVYLLTLSPSVSLEDSGELAVAGDHLGVPHPPGYPTWTMLVWCFARLFSWVTFRGHPTPAWSIALASGVCGAFAAGCTAMLINRTAADMLRDARGTIRGLSQKRDEIICWISGVAGSLIFAFSPVMWSQCTIVEVYALGALFVMLVMLLTYRWMRQPSDKMLWLTAFVFGLGLTNYQVLLLAALPLVIVLFLRNIAMFRDFLLTAIPFGVGAILLWLGSLPDQPGLPTHRAVMAVSKTGAALSKNYLESATSMPPVIKLFALPSGSLAIIGLSLLGVGMLGLIVWISSKKLRTPEREPAARLILGAVLAAAVFALLLSSIATHTIAVPTPENPLNPANPILDPSKASPVRYAFLGALLVATIATGAFAAVFGGKSWSDPWRWGPVAAMAVAGFIAITTAGSIPLPETASYHPDGGMGIKVFDLNPYGFLVVAALLLLVALASTVPNGLFFALPVAIVEFTAFVLVTRGAFLGLTHPSTWWFWAPVSFNFIVLGLAALALPTGRSVAMTFLAGELGVSFYIYMPIASDLRNPPMNWGYPRTWEGFKHAITRGQYEKISPTNIFSPRFLQQLGGYFTDLRTQFTLLLAPLGFLPFAAWRFRKRDDEAGEDIANGKFLAAACGLVAAAVLLWGIDNWVAPSAISDGAALFLRLLAFALVLAAIPVALLAGVQPMRIAIGFVAVTVLFVILGNISAIEHVFDASRVDKLTFAALLVLSAVGGATLFYEQLADATRRMLASKNRSEQVTVGLVLAGLGFFVIAFLFKSFQALIAGLHAHAEKLTVQEMTEHWTEIMGSLSKGYSVLALFLAVAVTAAVVFALHEVTVRRRIASQSLDTISQQWIIGTVANFLVMSVLLIVLANPKGDLQDNFIQKVKFISSHGLFALWIGYGLVFAITSLDSLVARLARRDADSARSDSIVSTVFLVVVLSVSALLPLIPIQQNYCNDRLVFELGGAEQNGHDYGWQFGNYQLRGADAITEELEPDEEPLPNPSYPLAMGTNAVFFGGTDPGRFVPTYMIYSANVRPDVFLITQNALADNTFMAVTRDLYADANPDFRPGLWIPTPDDSASAFQIYVDEVNSGKRPKNADLNIENGRVQVVGALGVMEINGILCKMIHDRNKKWHEFFVEESYVIPWMYPYMTPNGLILRLNSDPCPFTQQHATDDRDFWDWYVRRLTRDRKWRRDLVAQKSFSKLRSALAGLYVARNRYKDAEAAYAESRMLYPVSPEANFRLVQDILLREGRYDEALEVVNTFCRADPNNDRGPMFRKFIEETQERQRRLQELLARTAPGQKPSLADALEIARGYRDLGTPERAASLLSSFADEPKISVANAFALAVALDEAGAALTAARVMDRVIGSNHVRNSPANMMAAIHIYMAAGNYPKAISSLNDYLKTNPGDWRAWSTLAAVRAALGDTARAKEALLRVLVIAQRLPDPKERNAAYAAIEQNPQLMAIAQEAVNEQRQSIPSPMGIPIQGATGIGGNPF